MKHNLLIAHSGGPTAVINASLAGVISSAQKEKSIGKILAARHGIEGVLIEDFIDLTNFNNDSIKRLETTPSSAIGSCRYKIQEEDYDRIVDVFKKNNIKYFLYNGGNDSMDTCNKIYSIIDSVNVIGIPKTIDNDLAMTDHCPGFGSAAKYYAISTAELALDIQALNIHVSIIEIMGRNSGWLTASTALAHEIISGGAPQLIYLPEKPFIEEKFLDDVNGVWKKHKGMVVAVSEGLIREDGQLVVNPKHESAFDSFGHPLAGNVSQYLADIITLKLGIRARSEKPGLLGRVSRLLTSEVDREEAYYIGVEAVRQALRGESGFMIGLHRVSEKPYMVKKKLIPLKDIANLERKVPDEFINEQGNNINELFLEYVRPLVGKNLPDYFQF